MSVPITITVAGKEAQAFKDKIREEAMEKGWSVSELVVEALADYFRRKNGPK